MNINDSVIRRFGEMSLALCEAEGVIAAKDERIRELENALHQARTAEAMAPSETSAQEMLESR